MKILAIDTASTICSVALLEDLNLISHLYTDDSNTHSINLMPLISNILEKNNISLEDIDLFTCNKGPGSFTGIRIGISTIKAFCDVTKRPCTGISSLKALSYNVKECTDAYVCSLIDAKHGNVYAGIFSQDTKGVYHKVTDYFFDNIENTIKKLNKYNKKIFFVGNASIFYKDMIQSKLNKEANFISDDSNAVNVGIASFYKLKQNRLSSPIALYLKKSSAEESLLQK